MKKKEKIRILEAENKALNEKCEKAFEMINATTVDDLISGDYQEKYVPGIITDSPNIVFDFTEHDMKVLEKKS